MDEQTRQQMLTEERYATVRSQVRDIYDEYRGMLCQKNSNNAKIKELENKQNMFNKNRIQKNIDAMQYENQNLDDDIAHLKDRLQPLADEMAELEEKLGTRAEYLYGKDPEWWIRK